MTRRVLVLLDSDKRELLGSDGTIFFDQRLAWYTILSQTIQRLQAQHKAHQDWRTANPDATVNKFVPVHARFIQQAYWNGSRPVTPVGKPIEIPLP